MGVFDLKTCTLERFRQSNFNQKPLCQIKHQVLLLQLQRLRLRKVNNTSLWYLCDKHKIRKPTILALKKRFLSFLFLRCFYNNYLNHTTT